MKNESGKIKNISTMELFLFLFSMVFLVEFNGVDIRIPISLFWLFKSLLNNKSTIKFKKTYIKYILMIGIIIIYSLIVISLNNSYNFFIPLRYFRSMFSLVIIIFYITTHANRIRPEKLINAIIYVLLLHATVIIIEIIIPSISNYIYMISGYSKKELGYRAAGFVSGFDFAGMYLNIGLFFSMCKLIVTDQSKYFIFSLIFIISTFLTSRTTSLLLLVTLFALILIAREYKNHKVTIVLTIFFYVVIALIFAFFILSTDVASSIKSNLLLEFPFLNELYNNFDSSYANYDIFQVIKEQLYLPSDNSFISGLGEKALTDPGYLNSIYSIGFIGLLLIFIFYITILLENFYNIRKHKKSSNLIDNNNLILFYSLSFIIVISFIMEFKLSFLFSTGIFELMSIILVYTWEQGSLPEKFNYQHNFPEL